LVTDTEDCLGVRDYDEIDLSALSLRQVGFFHVVNLGEREEQPIRATEETRVVCDGFCL